MEHRPTTISGWALAICSTLDNQGFDGRQILQDAGITQEDLANPRGRISVQRMGHLWHHCVAVTGDDAFGVQVGQQVHPATFDALGYMMMACRNLHEALAKLSQLSEFFSDSITLQLEQSGNETRLCIRSEYRQQITHEAVDAGIAGMLAHAQHYVSGNRQALKGIHLQRPAPQNRQAFEQFFGPGLRFSCADDCILFDSTQLAAPLPAANDTLIQINEQAVLDYLASAPQSNLATRIRQQIIALLPEGSASETDISATVGLSPRTLQRKLQEQGTSYQQLLTDARQELAQHYLADPGMNITQVAYQLGFTDPSNFSRAFKQWFGMSPSQYRQQNP